MARSESSSVDHELLSEPHVSGHRISVRQLQALVEEEGESAEAVADRFRLDVADVYRALAYYHDNPAEMREVKRARREAFESFREEIDYPDGVDPGSA